MDINPANETFYTSQYQEVFLKYVENEFCAKHSCVPVIKPKSVLRNNPVASAMAAGSG